MAPTPETINRDMLETLRWVLATLNWLDESPAELLDQAPSLRVMVKQTIAGAETPATPA